jgi:hypothetical protein
MSYHVLIGGEQQGPHEVAAVVEMIGRGEVTAETLVWTAGMTDWVPARDVAAFASHFDNASAGPASAGTTPQRSIPLPSDGSPAARLDIGQAFSEGFRAAFHAPLRTLAMAAVYFIIAVAAMFPYLGVSMLGWFPGDTDGSPGGFVAIILLTYVLSLAINSALYGGLSGSMLRSVRGQPFGVGSLLAGFKRIVPMSIFGFLYIVTVSIGLMLLVVPGVFLVVAFALTPFLIMDRQTGAIAGMRGSLKAVMGAGWWRTFAVALIMFVSLLAIMFVLIFGVSAGAVFMTASDGDPSSGGAAATAIVGFFIVQMAIGAIFAILYSAVLASIYEQARPALDSAADGA